MKSLLGSSSTNKCQNTGYHELSPGKSLEITSGNFGTANYTANERCYWSVYAPGAGELKFTVKNFTVSSSSI